MLRKTVKYDNSDLMSMGYRVALLQSSPASFKLQAILISREDPQGAPQSHLNAEPTYNNHIFVKNKNTREVLLHFSVKVIKRLVHYKCRRNLVWVEVLSFLFPSSITCRIISNCFLLEPKLFDDIFHSKWSWSLNFCINVKWQNILANPTIFLNAPILASLLILLETYALI